MKIKNKLNMKKLAFIYAAPLCILVTACGDDSNSLSKGVQQLTKTRETASQAVVVISEDFYRSCVRRYSFLPVEPIPIILRKETAYGERINGLEKCDEQWEIGNNFKKSHDLLLNYIASLEALSSDTVVVFPDTSKDKLVDAINGLPLNNPPDSSTTSANTGANIEADRQQAVKAGVGIFQIVSKIFWDDFQEKQLAEVIVNSNDDVQAYVPILKTSVQRGYIEGYLEQEQDNIDLYYTLFVNQLINEQFPNVDPNEPPEKLTLGVSPFASIDNEWRAKRAEVEKNIEIARLYIQFLNEIAIGHNALYALINDKPTEGVAESQASENRQQEIKELAQKQLERIKYIAKELEKEMAK